MLRIVLLLILFIIVARAFWRVVDNVIDAARGQPPGSASGGARGVPQGVQMVRDPVCGTYVVRDRAVALASGGGTVFFCSDACRDKYRVKGRTA